MNLRFDNMTVKIPTETDKLHSNNNINIHQETETETEKILCSHCQRTATNGIKCKGICVADNDY